MPSKPPSPPPAPIPALPTTEAELLTLLKQAMGGNRTALETFRHAFRDSLVAKRYYGNLAGSIQRVLLKMALPRCPVQREAVEASLHHLRMSLEGPNCPPLECLLVERILVCWLLVHGLEMKFAQELAEGRAATCAKAVEKAERRYRASIESLAEVRRLRLPMMPIHGAGAGMPVKKDGPSAVPGNA